MNGHDLTQGSVFSSMTLFALPLLLGNMMQQAYNLVDTWVVGRFVGSGALAGVGAAYALMVFLTSILIGLSMGSGIVFSLCFGRQDEQALKGAVRVSFYFIAGITAVLTALPLLLLQPILQFLNIPEEIMALTGQYLRIIFCGIPAVFVYNYFSAYLKAIGDSVVPLLFLCLSTVTNIILDLALVVGVHWGVAGAAAATVAAQYISGLGMMLYVLKRHSIVREALGKRCRQEGTLRQIVNYSMMTCLQQSVMNLGILMVQGRVNSFGTTVMAAFAAGVKIDTFAYLPAQEYANAFSTFIAQNRGAGRADRVRSGIRTAALTSLIYCTLASLAMWFLARPLLTIFIDPSETAILAEGVRYLHIEGSFYIGIGCLFLYYGLYRAIGYPAVSLVLTIVSLGTRVLLAFTITQLPRIGVAGIWWAVPIGWFLADTVGTALLIKTAHAWRRGQAVEG